MSPLTGLGNNIEGASYKHVTPNGVLTPEHNADSATPSGWNPAPHLTGGRALFPLSTHRLLSANPSGWNALPGRKSEDWNRWLWHIVDAFMSPLTGLGTVLGGLYYKHVAPSGARLTTKRTTHPTFIWVAMLFLVTSFNLLAQDNLLIKEVISREVSIHVGGIQTPEYKEVVSRETSVFIGGEPEPPYKEVISREVSVVITTPQPPTRITQLNVSATPSGDSVTLSWNGYNEWSEKDVARYNIYFSTRGFTNIALMTPYTNVPGETFSITPERAHALGRSLFCGGAGGCRWGL